MDESQAQIAERLARQAHAGQFRLDGVTRYITHPEAVAASVTSDEAKAVAWLHDTLEDTGLDIHHMNEAGISDDVIDAVLTITHHDQDYLEYIQRVASNPLAREVKLADIQHNLSDSPTEKQREKYAAALAILNEN
jgi:(p)ppGpp synthase/HD superfamily hydrolase